MECACKYCHNKVDVLPHPKGGFYYVCNNKSCTNQGVPVWIPAGVEIKFNETGHAARRRG